MFRRARFLVDDSAATTTEYAVVLMLVAGMLLVGGDALSMVCNATFSRTSAALGTGGTNSSGRGPGESGPGTADAGNTAAPPTGISGLLPAAHLLAWATIFVAGAIVIRGRYLRNKARKLVSELDCDQPTADKPAANPNFTKRQEIQRVLLTHFDDVLNSKIEVRSVMSRKIRAVSPSAPVDALRELLEQEGFHHLLVLEHDKLLGVISDRDIKGRSGKTARAIMTANPQSVQPGTQISLAITTLLHGRFSCLPVVENDVVCGILTATDLMIMLQCLMRLLEKHAAVENPVELPLAAPLDSVSAESCAAV